MRKVVFLFGSCAIAIYNWKMNQKSVRVIEENSLKVESISFAQIPHQSKLFLDFQADSPVVAKFYPEKNTELKDFAEKVLANYKTDRNALCDALKEINLSFGVGEKTLENIELLREKDCLAIVTGCTKPSGRIIQPRRKPGATNLESVEK